MIRRARFYDRFRPAFGRIRHQAQVAGFEAIFDACERQGLPDERFVAYILATAWHETGAAGRFASGQTMTPVREAFAASDTEAVHRLARRPYARRHEDNGLAYYGRGFVQLTWRENYRKMGRRLTLPLEDNPDLALEPETAARILVEGMTAGTFTGKALAGYFTDAKSETVGARKIVNGLDRAHKIARYGRQFYACLLPPPM